MSVTISICDNVQHCERHHLVKEEVEPCLCVLEGEAEPDCHYCKGSGKWVEKIYPFELNVANGNFSTLWNALGLATNDEDMYCGTIDARIVLRSLKAFDASLIHRAPVHDMQEGRCEIFIGGIDGQQAARYVRVLTEIAYEAERRESNVCWG